ncbi:MAG: VenA family class IV lanthipeptide [Pseudonocardiaceae bacterium]
MENFALVSSLHALPETAPVEIEGIQFGGGNNTCQSNCLAVLGIVTTLNVVQTVCAISSTC